MHSRQLAVIGATRIWRSFTNDMIDFTLARSVRRILAAAALSSVVIPAMLAAQRPDTTRRVDTTHAAPTSAAVHSPLMTDSLAPPISPGHAFLYSFVLPGAGQSALGRHKAGAAFVFVEAITLAMIRESAADVHEARRLKGDSTVLSYVDANGNAALFTTPRQFNDAYIQAREAHVEDWIALLVANHLFSGADAFVAAHLWDVKARLAMRTLPNGATALAASLSW